MTHFLYRTIQIFFGVLWVAVSPLFLIGGFVFCAFCPCFSIQQFAKALYSGIGDLFTGRTKREELKNESEVKI